MASLLNGKVLLVRLKAIIKCIKARGSGRGGARGEVQTGGGGQGRIWRRGEERGGGRGYHRDTMGRAGKCDGGRGGQRERAWGGGLDQEGIGEGEGRGDR